MTANDGFRLSRDQEVGEDSPILQSFDRDTRHKYESKWMRAVLDTYMSATMRRRKITRRTRY